MKLENQVVSLEIAKKLKELGVKQESYFHWYQGIGKEWYLSDTSEMMNMAVDVGRDTAPQFVSFSAFTVAELGEMLRPKEVVGTETYITKNGQWRCIPPVQLQHLQSQNADTEADARGKMLIYLIENKLITL